MATEEHAPARYISAEHLVEMLRAGVALSVAFSPDVDEVEIHGSDGAQLVRIRRPRNLVQCDTEHAGEFPAMRVGDLVGRSRDRALERLTERADRAERERDGMLRREQDLIRQVSEVERAHDELIKQRNNAEAIARSWEQLIEAAKLNPVQIHGVKLQPCDTFGNTTSDDRAAGTGDELDKLRRIHGNALDRVGELLSENEQLRAALATAERMIASRDEQITHRDRRIETQGQRISEQAQQLAEQHARSNTGLVVGNIESTPAQLLSYLDRFVRVVEIHTGTPTEGTRSGLVSLIAAARDEIGSELGRVR